MPKILDISAHKIVNSRGNYTIQTKVTLDKSIDKIADTYDSIQANLNPVDSKELPNIVKKFVG